MVTKINHQKTVYLAYSVVRIYLVTVTYIYIYIHIHKYICICISIYERSNDTNSVIIKEVSQDFPELHHEMVACLNPFYMLRIVGKGKATLCLIF